MRKFKEVLIDGDLLIFAVCAAAEYGQDPESVNIHEVTVAIENKIATIVEETNAERARIFLSKGNFRNFIRFDYKANRDGVWRPECLEEAREYVRLWLDAEEEEGLEADDLILINMHENAVGATIDKDIPQREGWFHYWTTKHQESSTYEVKGIGELSFKKKIKGNGFLFFCAQLLTGDPTDGILGCGIREKAVYKSGAKAGQEYMKRKGVGAKAAVELLKDAQSEREALAIVYREYAHVFGVEDALDKMVEQGRLLWMVREIRENELGQTEALMWHPNPKVKEWMNMLTGEISER